MANPRRRFWTIGGLAAGISVATLLLATATAGAAAAPRAQSSARVVAGSVAGTSLDTLAELARTTARNYGGPTVRKNQTPDAQLLDRQLSVPLGQLKSALGQAPGLSVAGTVAQQAEAAANGSAHSTASLAGLTLDLSKLTGSAGAAMGSAKLSLQGLVAHAAQAAGSRGAQSGSCTIAALNLDLTSPALAGLAGKLDAGIRTGESSVASAVQNALVALPLGSATPIQVTAPSPSTFTKSLTTVSYPSGSAHPAITLDLATATIHLDLATLLRDAGLDLCSKPDTNVISAVASALRNQLPKLLTAGVQDVLDKVSNAAVVCSASHTSDCFGITVTVAGKSEPLYAAASSLDSACGCNVLDAAGGPLGSAATDTRTGLQPLLNQAASGLDELASALSAVLSLTTDVQSRSAGRFSETALVLTVGGGAQFTASTGGAALLKLNLSNSTVGPAASASPGSGSGHSATNGAPAGGGSKAIQVDAGRPGPAGDGGPGNPLAWLGAALLIAGAGGAQALRMRAARGGGHS